MPFKGDLITLLLLFLLLFPPAAGAFAFPAAIDSLPPLLPSPEEDASPVYIELHGYRGFGVKEFNRVDGFALSLGATIGGRFSETAPRLDASVLYYTERSRFGWLLDFQKTFPQWRYLTAGIEWRRTTDTYDAWRMGDLESSLAAFLVKASLRNYYEREGVTGYLSNEVMTGLTLKTSYTIEEHASLRARDPWTVVGDSKEFRTNPPVDEGTFTALTFQTAYDTRDNIRLPHTGWFHEAIFEIARDELGGDIDHTRWFLHMRRYHILRAGHFLNARLALAGSSGNILEQRLLTAGGVGTLRGYDDASVSGDHMVLGNIEYRFPTGLEKLRPVLIVFNEVAGMIFLDAGRLWFSDIDEDEDTLSDIGVGFSGANFLSYFGLYLAWPLTGDEEGARLSVKIQRDF